MKAKTLAMIILFGCSPKVDSVESGLKKMTIQYCGQEYCVDPSLCEEFMCDESPEIISQNAIIALPSYYFSSFNWRGYTILKMTLNVSEIIFGFKDDARFIRKMDPRDPVCPRTIITRTSDEYCQ